MHGGFPKLKKGLTDFLQCECTVPAMSAACKKWTADELETSMQVIGGDEIGGDEIVGDDELETAMQVIAAE